MPPAEPAPTTGRRRTDPVGPLIPDRLARPVGEQEWGISPLAEVTPGPQLIVVRNDDSAAVRGYLKGFYDLRFRRPPHRYALIRPTPGADDRTTLALHILVGLCKNPETLGAEQLGSAAWDYARVWLAACQTSDLVIDRAHQQSADRLADLAELAAWLGCRVWLIWSGGGDLNATVSTARAAGLPASSIMPDLLRPLLPLPGYEPPASFRWESRTLPTAEFTTFRAACRQLLSRREFTHVDQLYLDAAQRTDGWLHQHGALREAGVQTFGAALAAWLRDVQLGPHTHPGTALITLRGTQAALFIRGVLLRWNPGTIDPRRHPHDLYADAKTAAPAITALSLHLNQPPLYFDCWRVRHATADGATLATPAAGDHRHKAPAYLHQADYRAAIEQASGVEEIPCAHTIHLPEPAQVILAAHRAHRLLDGAAEHDPVFEQTLAGMRETAVRTTQHLRQVPPWLHRDPCRYGGDIGLHRRAFGWLIERGLSVHLLDPELADQLNHPLYHRGEP